MKAVASKIFGIGLSKTGTTSLAHALEILGYRTKDYMGVSRYTRADLSSIDFDVLDQYDALTDTPIPSFYRELDARYPDSKFILTIRDRDGWLKSCKKQFTQRLADKQNEAHKLLFLDLYGTDVYDEQKFTRGYEAFVGGVMEHFKNRPLDLLVINIASGEGWDKLCPFLGKPTPDVPFPKANVTQIRWINIGDVVAIAREAGEEILRAGGSSLDPGESRAHEDPTEDVAEIDRLKYPGQLLQRAFRALQGDGQGARRKAANRARKVINQRLKNLTPQVPVLCCGGNPLPYAQRAKHNHLWLVDPLNGASESTDAHRTHTVNIALVEDGRPICGVVYAPATNTMYYAKAGEGSFKVEGGGTPQRLNPRASPLAHPVSLAHEPRAPPGIQSGLGDTRLGSPSPSSSDALAICLVAEGLADACRSSAPTMEWEIAAAHAVANGAGINLYGCKSQQVLKYNKKELINECFTVF
jgi:3'-phosphoadenosine 5'-phosphosulfate (PAPS) 3'-phosphatase